MNPGREVQISGWLERLCVDPLLALLSTGHPELAYFARRDLLEERLMRVKFGDDYERYMRQVRRWL